MARDFLNKVYTGAPGQWYTLRGSRWFNLSFHLSFSFHFPSPPYRLEAAPDCGLSHFISESGSNPSSCITLVVQLTQYNLQEINCSPYLRVSSKLIDKTLQAFPDVRGFFSMALINDHCLIFIVEFAIGRENLFLCLCTCVCVCVCLGVCMCVSCNCGLEVGVGASCPWSN